MQRLRLIFVTLAAVVTLSPLAHAQVPDLLPVPVTLGQHEQEELTKRKSQLETQWYNLILKVNDHNRKCNKVPAKTPLANECRENMKLLQGQITAHIEAVNSFNAAVRRATRIDRIDVPVPPIPTEEACDGNIACLLDAGVEKGLRWMQERYWDARVWANDPMHREWLWDAITIGTLPLTFQDVVRYLEARAAGGSEWFTWMAGDPPLRAADFVRVIEQMQRAAAEAAYLKRGGQPLLRIFGETRTVAEIGKVGQLTATQDAALLAIEKKYGIPFRIMGSKAEVARGLEVREDPLVREFLPFFRLKKWESKGSDLDLHIFAKVVEKHGWRKTLAMVRDIRKVFTGKYTGKTGLSVDLHGYSRRYVQGLDQLPSIGYGPDGRSQTLGWGSSPWEPKPSSEVGMYPKWQ